MHKLFIMGSKDCTLRDIEVGILKHYSTKDTITHIISGGTKNYSNSELWAKNNGKIIIKHSPKIQRGKSFVESCKERLQLCIEEATSILFIVGKEKSPSMDYAYSIVRNTPHYFMYIIEGGAHA